jgi:glucosamine--fructose-6-phosphate aminotransferase (isomerizing)
MNVTEQVILEQFDYWDRPAKLSGGPGLQPGTLTAVLGCGTSYYLAQSLAAILNRQGKPAIAVPGGEWIAQHSAYIAAGTKVQVLALSRSGETTETVQAARWSRGAGHYVVGITCAPGSGLAQASDCAIEMNTHPKEGIVMTVSASLMLLAGIRLAGASLPADLSQHAQRLLHQLWPQLKGLVQRRKHFVFLGSGELYGIANEAALKCQEMSLSYVQAYYPKEYRHGPISMVEPGVLAVMLYHPRQMTEEAELVQELQAKGATVLGLGGMGDISLDLPPDAALRALLTLPVLQLLGETIAQVKGLDSTAPRHLTKVVLLGQG